MVHVIKLAFAALCCANLPKGMASDYSTFNYSFINRRPYVAPDGMSAEDVQRNRFETDMRALNAWALSDVSDKMHKVAEASYGAATPKNGNTENQMKLFGWALADSLGVQSCPEQYWTRQGREVPKAKKTAELVTLMGRDYSAQLHEKYAEEEARRRNRKSIEEYLEFAAYEDSPNWAKIKKKVEEISLQSEKETAVALVSHLESTRIGAPLQKTPKHFEAFSSDYAAWVKSGCPDLRRSATTTQEQPYPTIAKTLTKGLMFGLLCFFSMYLPYTFLPPLWRKIQILVFRLKDFTISHWATLFCIIMLGVAKASGWRVIKELPYGYYTFLRLSVFSLLAYYSYCLWRSCKHPLLTLLSLGLSLLYNPFVNVELEARIWCWCNLFTIIVMFASLKAIKK